LFALSGSTITTAGENILATAERDQHGGAGLSEIAAVLRGTYLAADDLHSVREGSLCPSEADDGRLVRVAQKGRVDLAELLEDGPLPRGVSAAGCPKRGVLDSPASDDLRLHPGSRATA
jgi:hypothetical protein